MGRSPSVFPGERYGRLTVIRDSGRRYRNNRVMECVCECGQVTFVVAEKLRSGNTQSCGCLNRERSAEAGRRLGPERARKNFTTHGLSSHPLYATWARIRQRCNDPNDRRYHDYGGRGIMVDPRWNNFAQFLADVGEKPGPEYSLDRIDNDGPYSPENCRWLSDADHRAKHVVERKVARVRRLLSDPIVSDATSALAAYNVPAELVRSVLEKAMVTAIPAEKLRRMQTLR